MIGELTFLNVCVQIAMVLLAVSFVICVVRITIGPTLPDRILALDVLVALGIGFIAVIGVKTKFYLYLDIAISLGLVGFLATVAFSRFIMNRGSARDRMVLDEIETVSQTGTEGTNERSD